MMKKILNSMLAFVLSATLLGAASPVERIFVSTDREVYISGDMVWCSLFCLDQDGKYSPYSAVSYLELVSVDGSVAEAKIGLLEGRGAGCFRIPVTVPTGVYRLVSYTAMNTNEEGTPWMAGSKVLTIFNTVATARVKDGVEIVAPEAYPSVKKPAREGTGNIRFGSSVHARRNSDIAVNIENLGPLADVSFSVYHEDDLIPAAQDNSMAGFLRYLPSSASPRITGDRPLEYDGEIISARIRGKMAENPELSITTLSSAGAPSNLYIGLTENDRVRFMTNNIYGDREIVCEVNNLDKTESVVEIESPFIAPSGGTLPKLVLSKAQYEDLASRKSALRNEKAMMIDTLTTFFRHREDLLLESSSFKRYHLDDYTRFPSVREVLVEIIPILSVHKTKGKYSMRMIVTDGSDSHKTRVNNLLVMMDGVVLSDLDALMDFDAMLLEDVDIYTQAIVCGKVPFQGIANFVTKKNYVTALTFPSNVRVLDFKGVSYPVAYLGSVPQGDGPDERQLLYWDPSLRLEAGESKMIRVHTPSYPGRFRTVVEGLAADGSPVHAEWTFEVE